MKAYHKRIHLNQKWHKHCLTHSNCLTPGNVMNVTFIVTLLMLLSNIITICIFVSVFLQLYKHVIFPESGCTFKHNYFPLFYFNVIWIGSCRRINGSVYMMYLSPVLLSFFLPNLIIQFYFASYYRISLLQVTCGALPQLLMLQTTCCYCCETTLYLQTFLSFVYTYPYLYM